MQDWTDIVKGCRSGDPRAQRIAYDRIWRQVYPSVYRIMGDRVQAEDIMQDAVIKGFGKLGSLKEPATYPVWQKKICIHEALSRIRSRVPVSRLLPEMDIPDGEETAYPLTPEQATDQLMRLPAGYRTIVSLYLLEEYSHEEIGRRLGISASTSRSQYTRAIQKLKTMVRHEYAQ